MKVFLPVAIVTAFGFSFTVGGFAGFRTWTHTPVLDFENERLLMYFLVFLSGAVCAERGIFTRPPGGKLLYNVANCVAWLPVTAHIFVRLIPFFTEGFVVTPGYRLMWWITFYAAMVPMIYVVVESFRRYVTGTSRLWSLLNTNSYGVYIIHVIVIGVLGTLLLPAQIPGWAKYLTLALLVYCVSNLLVWIYRRVRQSLTGHAAAEQR
jgi:hypothetical protein